MIFYPPIEKILAERGLTEADIVAKFIETKEKTTTANYFGLCRSTVAKIIKRNGIESRFTEEEKQKMINFNAAGWSFVKIGKELGFSNKTVQRFLNKEIGEKNVKINYSNFFVKHGVTKEKIIDKFKELGSRKAVLKFYNLKDSRDIRKILDESGDISRNKRIDNTVKENKKAIIDSFCSGEKVSVIAKNFKVPASSICRFLEEWGLRKRVIGKNIREIEKNFLEKRDWVVDSYFQGMTVGEIAKEIGCGQKRISDFLKSRGITVKNKRQIAIEKFMELDVLEAWKIYTFEKLSLEEVGQKYGFFASVLGNCFKKLGFGVRACAVARINSLERKFAKALGKWGFLYETQFKLKRRSTYDLYIPSERLLIELSGDYWHGNPKIYSNLNEVQIKSSKRDALKMELAKENGYKILYIWETEINKNLDILEKMFKNLKDMPIQNNPRNFITDAFQFNYLTK